MKKRCPICRIDYYGNVCPNSPSCKASSDWNVILIVMFFPLWVLVKLVKFFWKS